jgi:CubicO group peptidase (beta-lactamase class C family)
MHQSLYRVCVAMLTILLICSAVTPLSTSAQELRLPSRSALDAYFQRVSENGFAGAVLIVKNQHVLLRAGYGQANDSTGTAFTPETVVDVGSLAKQFTAAAILKLEEQGRLHVSDTLAAYFARLPADRAGITLHQLLTHTAGLPNVTEDDLTPLSREAALGQIFGQPLTGVPGQAYHYCNACYTVLAAIIEDVTGQPYPDYMREKVFAANRLRHTGFYGEARWQNVAVAHGYWNGSDQGSPAVWAGPYWGVMGNGGVLSTVDDLRRWWEALHNHRALSAEQTEKLFARHVPQDDTTLFYGYGWGIEPSPLGTVITHNGGSIGGNSDLAYVIDQDLLIILLGNRIVYRTLTEDLPFEVRLYASDTRRQLLANLATNDLTPLPSPTFTLLPAIALISAVLGLIVLVLIRASTKLSNGRAREGFALPETHPPASER